VGWAALLSEALPYSSFLDLNFDIISLFGETAEMRLARLRKAESESRHDEFALSGGFEMVSQSVSIFGGHGMSSGLGCGS
jgi:hypothetical protein